MSKMEEILAFENFYRSEYSTLTRTLRLAGWSLPQVEDALQDAMLETLQRWMTVRSPRRYALTVVVALTRLRTQWKKLRPEVPAATDLFRDDPATGEAEFTDEAKYVLELLTGLPTEQRVAMALTVDGYSCAEIAEMTGRQEATVRSNLRHARNNLARRVNPRKLSLAEKREVEHWTRHRSMKS